jgi:ubiquinone/menaquinone biosynthesis C-methylase UbiE
MKSNLRKTMEDFTQRFTGRADAYSKYRPTYPTRILGILKEKIAFDSSKIIADLGSGTGILSKLFLEHGNWVFGVEPNEDMRNKAEASLVGFSKFISVNGTAENTTLKDRSIDLISIGQALHWFDPVKSWKEFKRIVNENGWLCVVYNDRKSDSEVMRKYESIVKKYSRNRPRMERIEGDVLSDFYPAWSFEKYLLSNDQVLDFEGLMGRLSSASYMPQPGDDEFLSVKEELKEMFDKDRVDDKITLFYETNVILGRI